MVYRFDGNIYKMVCCTHVQHRNPNVQSAHSRGIVHVYRARTPRSGNTGEFRRRWRRDRYSLKIFLALRLCLFAISDRVAAPHPASGKARLRLANSSQSSPPIKGRERVRGALVPMPSDLGRQGQAKIQVPLADDRQNHAPNASGLRRLLRRPRRFEISLFGLRSDWPSTAETLDAV